MITRNTNIVVQMSFEPPDFLKFFELESKVETTLISNHAEEGKNYILASELKL